MAANGDVSRRQAHHFLRLERRTRLRNSHALKPGSTKVRQTFGHLNPPPCASVGVANPQSGRPAANPPRTWEPPFSVNTFLPFSDFIRSARCLDRARLGKQRVECCQLLTALQFGPYQRWQLGRLDGSYVSVAAEEFENPDNRLFGCGYRRTPWFNHPATRMWRGHESTLIRYGLDMCEEWIRRGYNDTRKPWLLAKQDTAAVSGPPPWLGNPAFHLSHQSNLMRKDAGHYAPLFPGVEAGLSYVWPV